MYEVCELSVEERKVLDNVDLMNELGKSLEEKLFEGSVYKNKYVVDLFKEKVVYKYNNCSCNVLIKELPGLVSDMRK